jgi:glycosyltransferase involved in cell wall biosynthesis
MAAYLSDLISSMAATAPPQGRVEFVTARGPSNPKALDDLSCAVPVHALPGSSGKRSRVAKVWQMYVLPYLLFGRIARQQMPDIVHLHFGLYLTDWILLWLLPRRCKLVITAHDPVPHKWVLPRAVRFVETAILKYRYHRCAAIIVHSNTGARMLQTEFGVPSSRIYVVPLGTSRPSLPPRETPERRLSVLGTLREDKQVLEIIAAFQSLDRTEKAGWELCIAGRPESADYAERIKQAVASSPAQIRVALGTMSDAAFDELLVGSAYVVLAYSGVASMSAVLLRALATGTVPIVAWNSCLAEQTPAQCRELSFSSPEELQLSLRRAIALFGTPSHTQMRTASLLKADEYAWSGIAEAHWRVFARLASDSLPDGGQSASTARELEPVDATIR